MPITTKLETITPDVAFKYLETFRGNRAIRQTHVNYLASQMAAGLWRVTHQGIAFNTSGELVDGHHRMWAVIQSKTTIKVHVARDLNDEDVAFLDVGLSRDAKDAAHYKGVDIDPITWTVAKVLARGITMYTPKVPFPIVRGWYEFYKDGIDAAVEYRAKCQPARQKLTATMTAAIARAYYSMEKADLDRFVETLRTGQASIKADMAAVVLRDAWLTRRLGHSQSSEAYFKTSAALRAFNERRQIKTLQRAEDEVFKLPKLPANLHYKTVATSQSSGSAARKAMLAAP